MDIRTENLTILFVDIAGFTATTSRQSRAQNAQLLHTFDATLVPLIKRFKGTVVKSIGDALLLTFRSPTDAMLCAMALQDAMHAHNLGASDDEKIHIRVAANLGEVRVTKKDIFGEPVNVAARIEGVTPGDEIYLSEAVYMAMNKAEVPAQEVGFKELAGISQAVRVYCIPRFATHRLVPENAQPADQGNELLFPYGGMHHRAPSAMDGFSARIGAARAARPLLIAAAVMAVAVAGWQMRDVWQSTDDSSAGGSADRSADRNNSAALNNASSRPLDALVPPPGEAGSENVTAGTSAENTAANTGPADAGTTRSGGNWTLEELPAKAATSAPAASKQTLSDNTNTPTDDKHPAGDKNLASGNPASAVTGHVAPANPKTKKVSEPVVAKVESVQAAAPAAPVWTERSAKAAYRADKLSKAEYKRIINQLDDEYEARIRELKLALRAGKITRPEYDEEVRKAKLKHNG